MAFILPIIKNFLSYSNSCATYSRNSENGGLVTTISACFSSSTHSFERKSPGGKSSSPFSSLPPPLACIIFLISSRSYIPSPFSSDTSVISITRPFVSPSSVVLLVCAADFLTDEISLSGIFGKSEICSSVPATGELK